jgi:hypothetical protein
MYADEVGFSFVQQTHIGRQVSIFVVGVMRRYLVGHVVLALIACVTPSALGGMASPLPSADEVRRILRLNDSAAERFQAISFFVVVLLACAAVVRWLWNYLRRDFTQLPRLTFSRALVGVLLWGVLFVVVLTMIAGARELMTPGAWEKQGLTYRLKEDPKYEPPDGTQERRQQLERLRQALWHSAALHQGKFPSAVDLAEIPQDVWTVLDAGGMRFLYTPGLSVSGPVSILAWEPERDAARRLVLRTDGDIPTLSTQQIQNLLKEEKKR